MIAAAIRRFLDRHAPLMPTNLSQLDLWDGISSDVRDWMDAQ